MSSFVRHMQVTRCGVDCFTPCSVEFMLLGQLCVRVDRFTRVTCYEMCFVFESWGISAMFRKSVGPGSHTDVAECECKCVCLLCDCVLIVAFFI